MRLLKYSGHDTFSLTEFPKSEIPNYAILSHTWGADNEEVTFQDLSDANSRSKAGYEKLRFCAKQVVSDKLQYFWVDTCCIDKTNPVELQYAINSMFRWYQNAKKCYVYLSDVHTDDDTFSGAAWQAFQASRWFTRGWTLQELLASKSVVFFSKHYHRIGDKKSLEHRINKITGISTGALQGKPLSHFTVEERMLWAKHRETKYEEDKVYSLQGIFDIYIPLIYGEGRENAFKRLTEEIDKRSKRTKRDDFRVNFSLFDVSDVEHFVGREPELEELHKKLDGDGSRRMVVLHGLGGIGKTQLSVAYAKRHKEKYSAIFWLDIRDEDSIKQSFAKVAKQILREHPSAFPLRDGEEEEEEDVDEVVNAVKNWLSEKHNTRWLLIFDNYDNPKVPGSKDTAAMNIKRFLPESYQGSILIITRSSQVRIGHSIKIRKFSNVRDSLEILSTASRREGLRDDPDALDLARELDGLPLALATAGAYLDQVSISVSSYLRLYKDYWAQLHETSPQVDSYEDRTLYSTWQISYSYIEKQNDLSAKLLRFWANLDNQDLWLELLQHTDSDSPSWMRRLVKDEISFHQTVRVLCDHGLVEPDSNSGELTESCGYSIHKCVHLWTIHVLNKPWDTSLARLAIQFVGSHVPDARGDRPWLTRQRLSQHTARCRYVLNNIVQGEEMIWPCLQLGDMYKQEGKLTDAEWMYERALHDSERACGPENEATLDAVNNLANVFRSQGRLDEAEKMYQRALHGTEKALGPMDSSTLDTVNSLGNLYADQDKLTEAEQMYQRALEGYEKAYGATNTITLDPVNNLGLLYTKQGKFDEAEKMYQRALKGYEEELGPKHTVTLDTFNNLGILYADHGKVVEAEQIYRRVLQGYEETLGEDSMMAHIPALNTLWNIAELSENQGDLENAQTLYTKALLGYNKALGTNHPTSQESQDKVDELDILMKKLAVTEMVEPESKHQEEHQPPLQEAVSKSKRHRLLRKFGLR